MAETRFSLLEIRGERSHDATGMGTSIPQAIDGLDHLVGFASRGLLVPLRPDSHAAPMMSGA